MGVLRYAGAAPAAIGAVEFALFTHLAPRLPNIARRKRLLDLDSALNITVGALLMIMS